MIRIVITTPKRKRDPLSGLIYYHEGNPIGQAVIQERPNKTSKWKTVPVYKQDEVDYV